MKPAVLLLALVLGACDTGWGPDAANVTSREAPMYADGSVDCRCWLMRCWSLTKAGLAGQNMTMTPDPKTGRCYVISVREKWERSQPQAW